MDSCVARHGLRFSPFATNPRPVEAGSKETLHQRKEMVMWLNETKRVLCFGLALVLVMPALCRANGDVDQARLKAAEFRAGKLVHFGT